MLLKIQAINLQKNSMIFFASGRTIFIDLRLVCSVVYIFLNMRFSAILALLLLNLLCAAQEKPVPIALPDVAYPILGIKKSPSSDFLFLTLAGGRFLMYDISKGRLTEDSQPLWKNLSIKGFEIGGDAEFSNNEKYILVAEQNAMYQRDKAKPESFAICVLEVITGKIMYENESVNSAQLLSDNESVLIADSDGIEVVNMSTSHKGEKRKLDSYETACLNHAENILAVSYDPSKDEFTKEDGAGYNRKELKNAVRNKKLIAFYEYPSLRKLGVINEEVDVVFHMHFTSDDRYLLFFSRTWQPEHLHANLLNGRDKTNDLNQFQRIEMSTRKVDNLNFIYQTSEPMANFDLDSGSDVFVFGENRGLLAAKRDVIAVKFSEQQTILGTYTFRGRSNSRNLFSPAFAIMNQSEILVANGLKLSYWNFANLPNFTENIEPIDENAILDNAISQLETDLQNPESSLSKSITKKQINGLYLLNITIQKNGEVVSIFAQSDDKTNIQKQNILKDIILNYRFDVSLPKNERLKFAYTFNL
jgi:hypothetical protein